MRKSWDFDAETYRRYRVMMDYDRAEIDNPDRHYRVRIIYLDRIRRIISLVRKYYPTAEGIRVGDFGCAQGNVSLQLAEAGYQVYAADISADSVEYAKLKQEKGKVEWYVGNVGELELPASFLDAAILAEIIEDCAFPEQMVEKVFNFIRPGGHLIVTTPNAARLMRPNKKLPTLAQLAGRPDRQEMAERQFRDDHLFEMLPGEVDLISPPNSVLVETGYCYGSALINRYTEPLLRIVPSGLIEWSLPKLSKLPIINKRTFNSWYAIFRKEAA
jgi:2-polyprenyl-3-methyl-5-hydroxy-6-metoxy-1,4-benzoquinol methylase